MDKNINTVKKNTESLLARGKQISLDISAEKGKCTKAQNNNIGIGDRGFEVKIFGNNPNKSELHL
jgi:hypothetical protein